MIELAMIMAFVRGSFTVAIMALVIVPVGCFPNLGEIDLSSCMDECNDAAQTCLDERNVELISCPVDDDLCRYNVIIQTEQCLTTDLDCISDCIAETEDILKNAG